MNQTNFRRSIPKTLAILAGAMLLTLGSGMLAFHLFPRIAPWSGPAIAGYVGLPIFGVCTAAALLELLRFGPVVEVTAFGIRDRRLSPDLIPWIGISDISVPAEGKDRCVTLRLRPEARAKLKPAKASLFATRLNARGDPDVAISVKLLEGSLDDLVKAIDRARPVDVRNR
jgi:hypothetical protein